jgi:hypothetical protein
VCTQVRSRYTQAPRNDARPSCSTHPSEVGDQFLLQPAALRNAASPRHDSKLAEREQLPRVVESPYCRVGFGAASLAMKIVTVCRESVCRDYSLASSSANLAVERSHRSFASAAIADDEGASLASAFVKRL